MGKLDEVIGEANASSDVDDDDEVEVDFSGAVEFSLIPKGKYLGVLIDSETGETNPVDSEKKPERKMVWQYEIISDIDGDDEHAGRKLKRTMMLEGKGSGITKQALRAHGVDTEGDTLRIRPREIIAAAEEVVLTIGHRAGKGEYKDRTFEDIKAVDPVD